jgi:plastocyanin
MSAFHPTQLARTGLFALGALALSACGAAPPAASTSAPAEAPASLAAPVAPTPASTAAAAETATPPPAQPAAAGATGILVGRLTGKPKHLQDAVVFVSDLAGELANDKLTLDQKGQVFVPHVLPVARGTTVTFANSDATGHNVFSPDGEKYDLGTFGLGETRAYRFEREGVYTQLCKLHPSMLAYVVVLKNRWFALAGADGSFRIEGVPAGERVIEAWQEKARGAPVRAQVVAGQETRVEVPMARP